MLRQKLLKMCLFKIQPQGKTFDDMPFSFEISTQVLFILLREFGDDLGDESGVSIMGSAFLGNNRVGLFFDTEEEMIAMKSSLLESRLSQLNETFIW